MGFGGPGLRQIGSRHLKDSAIVGRVIAADAITTAKIAPDTILDIDIAPDAIGSHEIGDNAISYAAQIKDNIIGYGELTTGLQGSFGVAVIGTHSISEDKFQLHFEHGRVGTIQDYTELRTLIGSFSSPDIAPKGLAFATDKNRLWHLDANGYIYEIGTTTGNIIGSFEFTPITTERGLTFATDKNRLWEVGFNAGADYIYEIGTTTGAAIGSIPWALDPNHPTAIAFAPDKNRFWISSQNAPAYIYEVGTTTGNIIGSLITPGNKATGAAIEGLVFDTTQNILWVCDEEQNRIYAMGTTTGNILGSFATPSSSAAGIAFAPDTGNIWNVDYGVDYIFEMGTTYPRIGTYINFQTAFGVKPDIAITSIDKCRAFIKDPTVGSFNLRAEQNHPGKAMWMAWGSR